MPSDDLALRDQLHDFLRGEHAHAGFDTAIAGFPAEHFGTRPANSPHSAWELLQHIRFSLRDLLDFCTNSEYVAPQWPENYWPQHPAPKNQEEWDRAVAAVKQDMGEFDRMVKDPAFNLYAKIPWGEGQTLLREVLLAKDHTSYHLGQLVLLRKQLGIWKE